jgi:hypothetical protein
MKTELEEGLALTPKPSIEGMSCRLRRQATPHVKR